jgi:signal transduction histidine kinase
MSDILDRIRKARRERSLDGLLQVLIERAVPETERAEALEQARALAAEGRPSAVSQAAEGARALPAVLQSMAEGLMVVDEQGHILLLEAPPEAESAQPGSALAVTAEGERELAHLERDFVARVTHDLRAPLTSIRAALEILEGERKESLTEAEKRLLDTALGNADRLASMINTILDFSKIAEGQMSVHPAKEDAAAIALEARDCLAPWARKKRIEIELSAAPGMLPVAADRLRVVQVLVNLLSNAIKFTPVGGKISMSVGPDFRTPEKAAVFSVSDNGLGIPKDSLGKLFEKFSQAPSPHAAAGTGLGLAISKALVHLHQGRIWAESEEGRGAAFFFTIPFWTAP